MSMLNVFKLGDVIGGYCNGFFGRDDYEAKECVYITPRYAVFEYIDDGKAVALNYSVDLEGIANKWLLG